MNHSFAVILAGDHVIASRRIRTRPIPSPHHRPASRRPRWSEIHVMPTHQVKHQVAEVLAVTPVARTTTLLRGKTVGAGQVIGLQQPVDPTAAEAEQLSRLDDSQAPPANLLDQFNTMQFLLRAPTSGRFLLFRWICQRVGREPPVRLAAIAIAVLAKACDRAETAGSPNALAVSARSCPAVPVLLRRAPLHRARPRVRQK